MSTKKIIKYGLNGLVRTSISGTGAVLAAGAIKFYSEIFFLSAFKSLDSNPSAQEIYDEMGMIEKFFARGDCNIDSTNLQTSIEQPEQSLCLQSRLDNTPEAADAIIITPAVLIGFFCLKTLPKGLAYLQIAFGEAVNSESKVLTNTDFEKYKKQSIKTAPEDPKP